MRIFGEFGFGGVGGFTGGFGIDGKLMVQLKTGLVIGAQFNIAEQISLLFRGEYFATFIIEYFFLNTKKLISLVKLVDIFMKYNYLIRVNYGFAYSGIFNS